MSDTWKESGAMVYVALTVCTFAAVLTCCIWFTKKHRSIDKYNQVNSEEVNSEEEVELTTEETTETKETEHKAVDVEFTLEDSDDEVEIDLGLTPV